MPTKEEKEAFVTGHTGTTVLEVLLVCMSAPVGIFLFHEVTNFYRRRNPNLEMPFKTQLLLEAITILLPMTICQTVLLDPYGLCILAFEVCIAMALHFQRNANSYKSIRLGSPWTEQTKVSNSNPHAAQRLEFLTFYRSTVSYLTFVAILAVDFPVFPRSFAKTEVSGYGLMDLGAGSFCVSGGLVSWYARRRCGYDEVRSYKEKGRFKRVVLRCFPLLAMGFIRLFTTKGLEYQEHVSEYGIHWNFFFTLAVVGICSTFLRAVLKMKNSVWWIMILTCYQLMLSFFGMQEYIESAPRRCGSSDNGSFFSAVFCDAFAANREGIVGCAGYLILHLASEDIANYCLWNSAGLQQGIQLAMATTLCWTCHWFTASYCGIPSSRRSTNITFIFWTLSHNMSVLFLTWLAFSLGCSKRSALKHELNPPIFAAVNRHGLIVFIVANLMTGAVNLSMDTLAKTDTEAIAVIFLYLCGVGAVALALERGSKTKKSKLQ